MDTQKFRAKIAAVRPYRQDGYMNVLNRYGTSKDSSENYQFEPEPVVPDVDLTIQYEDNGLFSKIIDTPAEEALKHGFDLGIKDKAINAFVENAIDALEWEEKAATAIKWARLYGGSIIVMLIDDGGGLEDPLNVKKIKSIDELRVYERAVVQPDYSSLYAYDPGNSSKNRASKFGMPEFYRVNSLYGSFTVHESRCLTFRNGILPERITNPIYRFWGTPEYVRIKRAMRDTITAHGNGPKLLDRSVQPIYKMKDLAALLSTDDGEEQVIKRLQLIDLARGIMNSIAIDKDGEDYDFKSFQFTGVKDVIDATCNMLSAITNIPQTILFGRSPAGQNSTGESDLENYYNYTEKIQKLMLRKNLHTLLDILFKAGMAAGDIDEDPDYELKFSPLWSLNETEQATVDQTKAQTAQLKAQTAQTYVDMQALDPSEVRAALAKSEDFIVEEILDSKEDDTFGLKDLMAEVNTPQGEVDPTKGDTPGGAEQTAPSNNQVMDEADLPFTAAATLVVKGGRLLVGERKDHYGKCGPGGHIEQGETPEQAAIREAEEEFGIKLGSLIRIADIPGLPSQFGHPVIFLCTDFTGTPKCDENEMHHARFESLGSIMGDPETVFVPFYRSIEILLNTLEEKTKGATE